MKANTLLTLVLTAACIVALGLTCSAAAAQPLSIEAVIEAAAQQHPTVLAKVDELRAARSNEKGATWQRYPAVTASAQGLNGQRMTLLSLQQPLWTGGRLESGSALARARVAVAEGSLREAQIDVAYKVVAAWQRAAAAGARVAAATKAIAELQLLGEMVKRRVAAGLSPEVELLLLSARLEQALADLNDGRVESQIALSLLTQLSGSSVSDLPVATQLADADLARDENAVADIAVRASPTVMRLEAEREAAEDSAALARNAMLPTLVLHVDRQYGRTAGSLDPGTRATIALEQSFGPGLGMATRAAADSASANVSASLHAIEAARRDLLSRVAGDLAAMRLALEQEETARVSLEALTAVTQSYQRMFTAGRRTWLELLNAVRDQNDAHRAVLMARVQSSAAMLRVRVDMGDVPWIH
jgi:adhesin transport system outer membrane protein